MLTRIVRAERPDADLDGAGELCTELGCLPLAVQQAAAFLAESGLGPRGYLELLADYPAGTNQRRPAGTRWTARRRGSGTPPWAT